MMKNIFILLFLLPLISSCGHDKYQKPEPNKPNSITIKTIEINKINFYFENSGSINGYLEGKDFRQSIRTILLKIEGKNHNSYFVNSKAYPEPNMLNRITKNDIRTNGMENSDHKFIFTNAINNSKGNDLSIVITDGIYSVKNGNINDVEVDIKAAFEKALTTNTIETVVLKMSSNFDGTYYSETCKLGHKAIKINQSRPYYILLFGNKDIINKALNEIVVTTDLNGYKEEARFFVTKGLSVGNTALTLGEEKKGNFKSATHGNGVVREIIDAEKISGGNLLPKDRYLQFGIALDYSKLPIPKTYLKNKTNYSIEDNTGYSVEEIIEVDKMDKTSKTFKWIKKQNDTGKFKYTHIMVVKGKTNLFGDLKIKLNMNFPSWIAETGSIDDCKIKGDTTTTFAFDRLMKGVSTAYQKTNNKNEFFEIKINIKQ
ncbi:MAG: hypothetical protein GW774_13075 [Flavobacteriales bacterium]|nr:hypothetical protein [Flavobacteriales bacterium]